MDTSFSSAHQRPSSYTYRFFGQSDLYPSVGTLSGATPGSGMSSSPLSPPPDPTHPTSENSSPSLGHTARPSEFTTQSGSPYALHPSQPNSSIQHHGTPPESARRGSVHDPMRTSLPPSSIAHAHYHHFRGAPDAQIRPFMSSPETGRGVEFCNTYRRASEPDMHANTQYFRSSMYAAHQPSAASEQVRSSNYDRSGSTNPRFQSLHNHHHQQHPTERPSPLYTSHHHDSHLQQNPNHHFHQHQLSYRQSQHEYLSHERSRRYDDFSPLPGYGPQFVAGGNTLDSRSIAERERRSYADQIPVLRTSPTSGGQEGYSAGDSWFHSKESHLQLEKHSNPPVGQMDPSISPRLPDLEANLRILAEKANEARRMEQSDTRSPSLIETPPSTFILSHGIARSSQPHQLRMTTLTSPILESTTSKPKNQLISPHFEMDAGRSTVVSVSNGSQGSHGVRNTFAVPQAAEGEVGVATHMDRRASGGERILQVGMMGDMGKISALTFGEKGARPVESRHGSMTSKPTRNGPVASRSNMGSSKSKTKSKTAPLKVPPSSDMSGDDSLSELSEVTDKGLSSTSGNESSGASEEDSQDEEQSQEDEDAEGSTLGESQRERGRSGVSKPSMISISSADSSRVPSRKHSVDLLESENIRQGVPGDFASDDEEYMASEVDSATSEIGSEVARASVAEKAGDKVSRRVISRKSSHSSASSSDQEGNVSHKSKNSPQRRSKHRGVSKSKKDTPDVEDENDSQTVDTVDKASVASSSPPRRKRGRPPTNQTKAMRDFQRNQELLYADLKKRAKEAEEESESIKESPEKPVKPRPPTVKATSHRNGAGFKFGARFIKWERVNEMDRSGRTFLFRAASRGDYEACRMLVELGADISPKDHAGWTALHEACLEGHLEIASLLIQHGADVNCAGDNDDTPLHDAVQRGHRAVVECLLLHGASIDAPNADGETPYTVADEEMKSVIKSWLEKAKSVLAVDKAGRTPLHEAASTGDLTRVRECLGLGADISWRDNAGWTSLHEAALAGHEDIVQELLDHGALVDAKGFADDTPLHDAVTNGHVGVVHMLLSFGADPEMRNANGATPLELVKDDNGAQVDVGKGEMMGMRDMLMRDRAAWKPFKKATRRPMSAKQQAVAREMLVKNTDAAAAGDAGQKKNSEDGLDSPPSKPKREAVAISESRGRTPKTSRRSSVTPSTSKTPATQRRKQSKASSSVSHKRGSQKNEYFAHGGLLANNDSPFQSERDKRKFEQLWHLLQRDEILRSGQGAHAAHQHTLYYHPHHRESGRGVRMPAGERKRKRADKREKSGDVEDDDEEDDGRSDVSRRGSVGVKRLGRKGDGRSRRSSTKEVEYQEDQNDDQEDEDDEERSVSPVKVKRERRDSSALSDSQANLIVSTSKLAKAASPDENSSAFITPQKREHVSSSEGSHDDTRGGLSSPVANVSSNRSHPDKTESSPEHRTKPRGMRKKGRRLARRVEDDSAEDDELGKQIFGDDRETPLPSEDSSSPVKEHASESRTAGGTEIKNVESESQETRSARRESGSSHAASSGVVRSELRKQASRDQDHAKSQRQGARKSAVPSPTSETKPRRVVGGAMAGITGYQRAPTLSHVSPTATGPSRTSGSNVAAKSEDPQLPTTQSPATEGPPDQPIPKTSPVVEVDPLREAALYEYRLRRCLPLFAMHLADDSHPTTAGTETSANDPQQPTSSSPQHSPPSNAINDRWLLDMQVGLLFGYKNGRELLDALPHLDRRVATPHEKLLLEQTRLAESVFTAMVKAKPECVRWAKTVDVPTGKGLRFTFYDLHFLREDQVRTELMALTTRLRESGEYPEEIHIVPLDIGHTISASSAASSPVAT